MKILSKLEKSVTKLGLCLSAMVSLCAVAACSGGGAGTSGSTGQPETVGGDTSNARDLFYHNLSSTGGGSAAAAGGAGSSSGGSNSTSGSGSGSGSTGSNSAGDAGKMAAAVCWEIRSNDIGPVAMMCHTFPKAGFKQGDGLRFHFRPSQPCYAYIVMWKGSSGKEAVPLYPADGSEEKLEAGKEYAVPDHGMLEFDNKPGEEILGFILSPTSLSTKKALDMATKPTMIDPTKISVGRKAETGPLSLFAASDQNVPVADYKTTDRGDSDHDPFLYADNSKDPGNPIVVGIPFPHT